MFFVSLVQVSISSRSIKMNAFIVVFALGAVACATANPGVVSAPYLTVVPQGHGLEGQYVHDHTEKLYDDGSYKPQAHAVPLSVSPYGLVPSGSGLEGEYVHDNTEKLYDDGSYRPEARGIPLSASPYGLVPSGSGLEGEYVHDHSEHLYDDGSYKPGYYH